VAQSPSPLNHADRSTGTPAVCRRSSRGVTSAHAGWVGAVIWAQGIAASTSIDPAWSSLAIISPVNSLLTLATTIGESDVAGMASIVVPDARVSTLRPSLITVIDTAGFARASASKARLVLGSAGSGSGSIVVVVVDVDVDEVEVEVEVDVVVVVVVEVVVDDVVEVAGADVLVLAAGALVLDIAEVVSATLAGPSSPAADGLEHAVTPTSAATASRTDKRTAATLRSRSDRGTTGSSRTERGPASVADDELGTERRP